MACPNQTAMRPAVSCVAMLAAAALLAACGGSASTVSHTVTVAQTTAAAPPTTTAAATTPSTTSTTTTSTTATSTTTASTTSTTGGAPACTAADLTPSYLGSNGATGEIVLSFAVRNTSAAPCHTFGFPGVEFLSGTGAGLPTRPARTTHDVLGSTPATEIMLAPGHEATFRMITSDIGRDGGNGGCATAHSLQIIAPDDTATMRVSISDGAVECGTTSVSALQPGKGAIPGV